MVRPSVRLDKKAILTWRFLPSLAAPAPNEKEE